MNKKIAASAVATMAPLARGRVLRHAVAARDRVYRPAPGDVQARLQANHAARVAVLKVTK
ncbi:MULTISPECIES: hypothetical protein [Paraburkholderia]|uniref:Uncharacterized protein n=1 Tax=Paraburkholderia podalyriae TaxID=1938811 RepID=A0ABR7PQH0_9BURK|nr:hypothetical protein [Paraburkholderia podalyriae]MBC8748528.1 hypothetical protein [Paraburkholderia podalyriae]